MRHIRLFAAIISITALSSCKVQVENNNIAADIAPQPGLATEPVNLLATLERANRFQAFVTGLSYTGLDQLLKGPGPYTVLVPTQTSWNTFPSNILKELFLPENSARLRPIIANHIIAGRLSASDIASRQSLLTIEGKILSVSRQGTDLLIGVAKIIEPDIQTSNGFIQVIDAVIVPPPPAP